MSQEAKKDHVSQHDFWIERQGELFWWQGKQYPFLETILVMANTEDPHYSQGFRSWAEVDAFGDELKKNAVLAFGPRE